MSDRQTAAAAVGALAASLATVPAQAVTMYTESSLAGPGSGVRFLAVDDGELHRPPTMLAMTSMGSLPGGTSQQPVDVNPLPGVFNSYAIFGLSPSGGVFVSFSDASSALGRPFEDVFPGFQEAAVADAIVNGGPLLDAFANAIASDPRNRSAGWLEVEVVHFSNGAPYGTFLASDQPIPTPGALVLLAGSGAFGLGRRRRA